MRASAVRVWTALVTVYLVWGSTYLAIRYAIGADTGERGFPPLLMGALRFAIAGALLLAWSVRRPAPDGRPDPLGWPQWRATAIVGVALLLGGNGFVVLGEQRVTSSIAAVLVATVPIWAVLIGLLLRAERLTRAGAVGLLAGFAGVAILSWPSGDAHVDSVGALMLVAASLSWAAGSYYSRTAPMPRRPLVMTAMEMLCGSVALGIASVVAGDVARFDPGRIGPKAWTAMAYLIVFGAMLAFTAYVWVLRNAKLSLVTTYAYVNPVVAVVLGAIFLSEPITARTLLATAIIVIGVALVVTTSRAAAPAGEECGPAIAGSVVRESSDR